MFFFLELDSLIFVVFVRVGCCYRLVRPEKAAMFLLLWSLTQQRRDSDSQFVAGGLVLWMHSSTDGVVRSVLDPPTISVHKRSVNESLTA